MPASIVRRLGDASTRACFQARAVNTRWTDETDPHDKRMETTVEVTNTCARDVLVDLVISPRFGTPYVPLRLFEGAGTPGWPQGMRSPGGWVPGLDAFGESAYGGDRNTTVIDQNSDDWRPIALQAATCERTRIAGGRRQLTVDMRNGVDFNTGFEQTFCTTFPEHSLSVNERNLLARMAGLSAPPGEDPAMTRCMNRNGDLPVADAEAACGALGANTSNAPAVRAAALYDQARIRFAAGDYAGAIALGNQALAIRPSAEAHNNLGAAYYESGDYTSAMGHFSAALALNPHHPNAAHNLAMARLLSARPELRQQAVEARAPAK